METKRKKYPAGIGMNFSTETATLTDWIIE